VTQALTVTVFMPLAGALLLVGVRRLGLAGWLNVLICSITLAAALVLAFEVARLGVVTGKGSLRVDDFNVYLLVLTAFVGMTTSIFSRPYMQYVCETGKTSERGMHLYHVMFQAFMFTMMLALATDNLGVLWVAIEGATLATVLLVSLYRTPEWCPCIVPRRRSRQPGSISSSVVSASRWPCSAPCCCISPPST